MRTTAHLFVLYLFLALTLPLATAAQQTPAPEPTPDEPSPEGPRTFAESLKQGKAAVGLRLRFEDVSQDGITKDAHAFTLRTTLGYSTAPFKGLSFKIEAENVAELGSDLYNNAGRDGTNNGVRDRPVMADPAPLQGALGAGPRLERGVLRR